MDERIKKLAKVLVHHSCRVQQGDVRLGLPVL